jgi:lactoylglutathione lyase
MTSDDGWQDGGFVRIFWRVGDSPRARAFYQALGLQVTRVMTTEYGTPGERHDVVFMGVPSGNGELEVSESPSFGQGGAMGPAYGYAVIGVANLDAALERLAADGFVPESPPGATRNGGPRICFLQDPDGHRIELVDAGA